MVVIGELLVGVAAHRRMLGGPVCRAGTTADTVRIGHPAAPDVDLLADPRPPAPTVCIAAEADTHGCPPERLLSIISDTFADAEWPPQQ